MIETELARFTREDMYAGRGKHTPPVTVRATYPTCLICTKYDYSLERQEGLLVNGKLPKDQFCITVRNCYDENIKVYRFDRQVDANKAFLALTKQNKGFRRGR